MYIISIFNEKLKERDERKWVSESFILPFIIIFDIFSTLNLNTKIKQNKAKKKLFILKIKFFL